MHFGISLFFLKSLMHLFQPEQFETRLIYHIQEKSLCHIYVICRNIGAFPSATVQYIYSTLLQKLWWISLYVTDEAIAKTFLWRKIIHSACQQTDSIFWRSNFTWIQLFTEENPRNPYIARKCFSITQYFSYFAPRKLQSSLKAIASDNASACRKLGLGIKVSFFR